MKSYVLTYDGGDCLQVYAHSIGHAIVTAFNTYNQYRDKEIVGIQKCQEHHGTETDVCGYCGARAMHPVKDSRALMGAFRLGFE